MPRFLHDRVSAAPDRLFGWRLPVPRGTLYDVIGAHPEASADEIRVAKTEATRRLKAEETRLETQLEAVYSAIPDLKQAQIYAGECAGKGNEQAVRTANAKLAALERQALAKAPEFHRTREKVQDVRRDIERLNRSAFDKPEQRYAYDRLHPPLALLKIEPCASHEFLEGRTLLLLLRREVSSFLSAQGEPVFHPSDLTRKDFSGDFARNKILDGGSDE